MSRQYKMTVVKFQAHADTNKLAEAIADDPSQAEHSGTTMASDGRSLLRQAFSRGTRIDIHYWDQNAFDRLRRKAEELGFQVEGFIPRPYVRIKMVKSGKKQDKRGFSQTIVYNKWNAFVIGDYLYVDVQIEEAVIIELQKFGYTGKDFKHNL